MELELYTQVLNLPKEHYEIFKYIQSGNKLIWREKMTPERQENIKGTKLDRQKNLRKKGPMTTKEEQSEESAQTMFEKSRLKLISDFLEGRARKLNLGTKAKNDNQKIKVQTIF